MNSHIIEIATQELKNPSLGVTKQVVSSHNINAQPIRIHTEQEQGTCVLYFTISNEDYYFVLVLTQTKHTYTPSSAYIESNVRVYISIDSTQKTPSEITELLKMAPTYSRIMGKPLSQSTHVVSKSHRWCFEPQKDMPESFDKKLTVLLQSIQGCRKELKCLSQVASITFVACYKGYKEWMGGICLESDQMKLISEIGADFWVDLYASGPGLPK